MQVNSTASHGSNKQEAEQRARPQTVFRQMITQRMHTDLSHVLSLALGGLALVLGHVARL